MSDPQPYGDEEWRERLQAAVEKTLRSRHGRAEFQRDHKASRDAGLKARHQAKLARADQRLHQAQQDGPDDSWWEE